MERILHLMLASACLISVHLNRTGSGTGKFVGVKGQHFMIDGNPIILGYKYVVRCKSRGTG